MTGQRSLFTWAVGSAFVVSCIAVGFVLGAWFTQNYRIVKVSPDGVLRSVADPSLALGTPGSPSDRSVTPTTATASTSPGLFSFRFTPGEQLRYKLDAQVTGKGFESIGPADIGLQMGGDMTLKTESVDSSGNGNLVMTYDRMAVRGDFMGSDYRFDYSPQ